MGYTEYFHQKKNYTDTQWLRIRKAARAIIKAHPNLVCSETDSETGEIKPAIASLDEIVIEGIGDDNYESFEMTRKKKEGHDADPRYSPHLAGYAYECCKTGNFEANRYGVIVQAVLICAHHFAPKTVYVDSDGTRENWESALQLAIEATGIQELKIPDRIELSTQ